MSTFQPDKFNNGATISVYREIFYLIVRISKQYGFCRDL